MAGEPCRILSYNIFHLFDRLSVFSGSVFRICGAGIFLHALYIQYAEKPVLSLKGFSEIVINKRAEQKNRYL